MHIEYFLLFLLQSDHFYCYYFTFFFFLKNVSLILPLISSHAKVFFFFFIILLQEMMCSLQTLHSQATCNSLENRFSALSFGGRSRTGSEFRLLSSKLEAKKVPVLMKHAEYPLQMPINLSILSLWLSHTVCTERMAKCCVTSDPTGWKFLDHISSKDSTPHL